MNPMRRRTIGVAALGLLAAACAGCGYSDFRLPQLSPPETQVHYEWEPRDNPVLPHGNAGDPDSHDALNPSVVRSGNHYYNFYSGFDGKVWRTLLATSADGLIWKKEGVVLAPEPRSGEGDYIAANGSALFDEGEFRYWYQAGLKETPRLGSAHSKDGRNWRRVPFPVLDYGPRGSWDERGLADPYTIKINGYFYLFYLGEDRARSQRLGAARSADGEHWQKLRSNPILDLGKYGSFDEMGLGEPAVWIAHGYYWMLYTGRDARQSRRLGMARSIDGVRWEKLPEVFAGSRPWDSRVICDPTIELRDGRLSLWFGGGDAPSLDENLNGQIGVADLHAILTGQKLAK